MVLTPKRITLDSSAINCLTLDCIRQDSEGHDAATQIRSLLSGFEWLPTLSYHQLIEIAQHSDSEVVRQRIQFLSGFPAITWVRNTCLGTHEPPTQYQGTIIDLYHGEISSWRHGLAAAAHCKSIRESAFAVSYRHAFLHDMINNARVARGLLGSEQKARTAASMSAALFGIRVNGTVAALRKRLTRDPRTMANNLTLLIEHLLGGLQARADPRATGLSVAIQDMLKRAAASTAELVSATDSNPLEAHLRRYGLLSSDYQETSTVQDLANLAEFRATVRFLSGVYPGWLSEAQILALRPHMAPSYLLNQEVRFQQLKSRERAHGSDLIDADLIALALYSEICIVDKRTFEMVRRVRKTQPDLDKAMGTLIKWSGSRNTLHELRCAMLGAELRH